MASKVVFGWDWPLRLTSSLMLLLFVLGCDFCSSDGSEFGTAFAACT